MLTEVDKLLLSQYLTIYQTLHYKLYNCTSDYIVISLNKDSVLTDATVNKLRSKVYHKGTLYLVLYKNEPICYFTMLRKQTSCISNNLIIKQIGYSTMYDTTTLIRAMTVYTLLTMYERKLYNVDKIWFYLNKPYTHDGKLYQHSILHRDIGSNLKLETLQQYVDKKYRIQPINNTNIFRVDRNTLQCIGSLMMNNTDIDYLSNFCIRLVRNNTLNLVYMADKYPIAVIVSTHDTDDTLHNVYGDTCCLNSYVASMLLNSKYNCKELYIDDCIGTYSSIDAVKCMYTDKYISSVNITKHEYKHLGDTICNV